MFRKIRQPKKITWKSFWLLYIVLLFAGVLGMKEIIFPHDTTPTSTVPPVSYEDVTNTPPASTTPSTEPPPTTTTPTPSEPDASSLTPQALNLAVPFTSQAPTGNWDELHEDTCEEASFYMTMEFYRGNVSEVLSPSVVDPILKDMVDKETADGLGGSISLPEAKVFLKEYANIDSTIIDNPSVDDIKALIEKGEPVIVPAAGRELGNPNFTGEGPLYHMLVIRGFDDHGNFITNDPGTRKGENYTYSTSVLMNAIGDWNNGDPANGAKRILVITPESVK